MRSFLDGRRFAWGVRPSGWLQRRRRGWLLLGMVIATVPLLTSLPRRSRAYVRHGADLAHRLARADATTVQTLNVFGLPWPIGTDVVGRCRRIADDIVASAPDLIALQEVWDEAALAPLLATGYHASGTESPQGLFGRTGLLTLTRLPILDATSRCFAAASGADALVGKGALCTFVELPGDARLAVWNVHLQSGADDGNVRRQQIGELLRWIAEAGGTRRLVLGDFNCGPGDGEWRELVDGLGRFGLQPCACDRPTYDPPHNPLAADEPPTTIDHVFVDVAAAARAPAAHRIYDRPRNGAFLSDHFGLEVGLPTGVGRR